MAAPQFGQHTLRFGLTPMSGLVELTTNGAREPPRVG